MDKYQFSDDRFSFMEDSCIPFAVYQFIDKRVVTLVLTAGFRSLFEYEDASEDVYALMDNDMYRDTHPDDVARIADAAYRFATQDEPYDVVYRTKASEGYRIIHAHGEHVNAPDGTRLAVIWYGDQGLYHEDATGYESSLNRSFNNALHADSLFQRNYYDQLTGLPNMTYFFEIAEAGRMRMREQGKRPALLFINLNGMKYYNRKYGFAQGDQLICNVARVLVGHYSNESCSRFAQDHFVVLTEEDGLEDTIEEVLAQIALINDGNSLSASVGIYLDTMGEVDVGSACDRAKYACDVDRDTFSSGFRYFNEDMLAKAEKNRYIVDNLDRAIEEEWIEVYYQPIVRAANGKVCDEEALARWNDPVRGLLPPDEFVPILEEAKLIYKLDLFVVDTLLRKMQRQADEGLYVVPQSVNLSRSDFDAIDIVEEVRKRVDAAHVGREKLTIEITESTVGSDFDFMKAQIERFQELGFDVWMDDFGSGYSTLDVLQHIHFDLIKLDMRFMERFEESDENKVILTELVKMAMGLGIDTVAEGVETQEQVDFLREIGCTKLQGFYFCQPIPLSGIIERNKLGTQIGFENPAEAAYYTALGRINLHDASAIAHEGEGSFGQYFDTVPMAIIETNGSDCWITRSNKSYRIYMEDLLDIALSNKDHETPKHDAAMGTQFRNTVLECAENGGTFVINESANDAETSHAVVKRIAVNPVTGNAAVAVVALATNDAERKRAPVTYAHIAKVLSSDYRYLYYVNLDTEEFVQFTSGNDPDGLLTIERHGNDFFLASRTDARKILHDHDQDAFISEFTKENVVRTIVEQGAFIASYRQIIDGQPRSMVMKAVLESDEATQLVIGVSDVETQVKQRQALERIQAERIAYTRLNALSDEYLCIYIVDAASEHYEEYSATSDYSGLGLAKEGDDFFSRARKESAEALFEADQERFTSAFTKSNVLDVIEQDGAFTISYRLLIDGVPTSVTLKAVLVEEDEGARLVIGVR